MLKQHMEKALQLAEKNVAEGGWPFSAVITRGEEVISEAVNSVHKSHDPSDHAEISAIRKASKILQSADLSGCEMYVVGLPCPMCATCIVLSKIGTVIYAVDVDAKDKALTKLPLTEELYRLISENHGGKAITYQQMPEYQSVGIGVFKLWNDGLK